MNNTAKKRLAIELGKDLLILLLCCTAVLLAMRGQLFASAPRLFGGQDTRQTGTVEPVSGIQADAACPLRIAVSLPGSGGTPARLGLQYDPAACQALFQQLAAPLAEALSAAGTPEQVSRQQWEQALSAAPGVVLDFQSPMPLPVLVHWLAGEDAGLTAQARRLALYVQGDGLALCWRDETSGAYFHASAQGVDAGALTDALSTLTPNGSQFAFENPDYDRLDPDTLLLPQTASMPVYAVSDPMGDGRDSLETLMGYLNISADASSFYSAGSEQVARSESDSLRLSQSGFATYEAGEARSGRFPVPVRGDQITLADAVDACRRLAAATVGSHCGQARLYLSGVTQQEDGLEVCFDYSLSGAPVQLSSGRAARFWVSQGQIVKFELSFRSYAKQAGTAALLPTRQAAAALAVEHPGHELLLVYRDAGGDTASADWAAAGTSSQEEG